MKRIARRALKSESLSSMRNPSSFPEGRIIMRDKTWVSADDKIRPLAKSKGLERDSVDTPRRTLRAVGRYGLRRIGPMHNRLGWRAAFREGTTFDGTIRPTGSIGGRIIPMLEAVGRIEVLPRACSPISPQRKAACSDIPNRQRASLPRSARRRKRSSGTSSASPGAPSSFCA